MSDELKNKSGKVKVMYVRSDDDSDKRTHNPRTGKGGGRPGKSRVDGRSRPARDERNSRGDDRKRDDRKTARHQIKQKAILTDGLFAFLQTLPVVISTSHPPTDTVN